MAATPKRTAKEKKDAAMVSKAYEAHHKPKRTPEQEKRAKAIFKR